MIAAVHSDGLRPGHGNFWRRIGPLGIAFTPDGNSVLISGGTGRNKLYLFDATTGGRADSPLATLDVPIYDMGFDFGRASLGHHRRRPARQLGDVAAGFVAAYC